MFWVLLPRLYARLLLVYLGLEVNRRAVLTTRTMIVHDTILLHSPPLALSVRRDGKGGRTAGALGRPNICAFDQSTMHGASLPHLHISTFGATVHTFSYRAFLFYACCDRK